MKQQPDQQTVGNDKMQMKLPAPSTIPSSSTTNGSMQNPLKTGGYTFFPNGSASNGSPNSTINALLDPPTSPLLYHSQLETLSYNVKAWSSYSAQYHPRKLCHQQYF
jgi:hypothetical protein